MLALQRKLSDELIAAGLSLERRRYTPHITLGRRIKIDVSPWPITPFGERVNKIELMKSERIDGRLTYTTIFTKK